MQSYTLAENTINAYRDLYEEFAEEASFLWHMRSVALTKPNYTAPDIKVVEDRISNHLAGLITLPDTAWEICCEAMQREEPGEIFTAAIVAISSQDIRKIQQVLEQCADNHATRKGLISALGWLPAELVDPVEWHMFSSGEPNRAFLTAASCSVRRKDSRSFLDQLLAREDCRTDEQLYGRCLRLIGELKRTDLAGELEQNLESESEILAFWSIWSSLLLGNRDNAHRLMPFALNPGPRQARALDILMRVLPLNYAKKTVAKLAESPDNLRAAVRAAAIAGDPGLIPWLLKQMRTPELARLAGESFCTITGLDLEAHRLTTEAPEDMAPVPNDDEEDPDVAMDDDEDLPWPDTDRLISIWKEKGDYFSKQQRYFMKLPISPENLGTQLIEAGQRRRKMAAMELALTSIEAPFVNVNARIDA